MQEQGLKEKHNLQLTFRFQETFSSERFGIIYLIFDILCKFFCFTLSKGRKENTRQQTFFLQLKNSQQSMKIIFFNFTTSPTFKRCYVVRFGLTMPNDFPFFFVTLDMKIKDFQTEQYFLIQDKPNSSIYLNLFICQKSAIFEEKSNFKNVVFNKKKSE